MTKYFLIASFSPVFGIRCAGGEEFVFAGVVWLRDDFLEAQAEFFEQGDGGLIGGLGDGDDALKAESRPAVVHHGGGGFARVALPPEFLQEREADVHVLEPIALQQAADADGRAGLFQLDQVQAKSEFAVAGDGASGDVAASVGEGARTAIADIFEEGGLVQKLQDERGVILGEAAQQQPFRFEDFHCGDVSISTRHISECARPKTYDSMPRNLTMNRPMELFSSSDVTPPVAETDAALARDAMPALALRDALPARASWRGGSAEDARRNRHPSLWWAE